MDPFTEDIRICRILAVSEAYRLISIFDTLTKEVASSEYTIPDNLKYDLNKIVNSIQEFLTNCKEFLKKESE